MQPRHRHPEALGCDARAPSLHAVAAEQRNGRATSQTVVGHDVLVTTDDGGGTGIRGLPTSFVDERDTLWVPGE